MMKFRLQTVSDCFNRVLFCTMALVVIIVINLVFG